MVTTGLFFFCLYPISRPVIQITLKIKCLAVPSSTAWDAFEGKAQPRRQSCLLSVRSVGFFFVNVTLASSPPCSHPVVVSSACGFWYGRGCLDTVLSWSAFGGDRLEFWWTVCSLLNVLLFVSFERFPNYMSGEKTEKLSVSKFALFFNDEMICLRGGCSAFVLDPHFRGIQNGSKKKTIWLAQKACSFSVPAKG